MKPPFTFHEGEVLAQKRWNTTDPWSESRKQRLLWQKIPVQFHARLESAPFFFLTTSIQQLQCDCSFKSGGPGIIKMLGTDQSAFADFNGNGAFMSLGNIIENPRR